MVPSGSEKIFYSTGLLNGVVRIDINIFFARFRVVLAMVRCGIIFSPTTDKPVALRYQIQFEFGQLKGSVEKGRK